jgi:opacity protein-like surface antigen
VARHRTVILALLIALCCCLSMVSVAAAAGSEHYGIDWNVVGGGGGSASSSHYALSGTFGQLTAGASASEGYRIGSGFWFAFGTPSKPFFSFRINIPTILTKWLQ